MNKNTINYIKTQLKTNPTWSSRAIVRLWECQTAAEQSSQITAEVNGVGFNSVDSFILTSFAEQVNKGRTLSPKQLAIAFKKLPKYSKQVVGFISAAKMAEIESKLMPITAPAVVVA